MDLEQIAFVVRPRNHWEALDLGILLARRWYLPLLRAWLVTAVPTMIIAVALLHDYPGWCLFVIWWMKPLHERLPLKVLSTAIFGDAPRVAHAIAQWRSVMLPGMIAALTLRRFAAIRPFDGALAVLEQVSGEARARRIDVLLRGEVQGAAQYSVQMAMVAEALVAIGLVVGVQLLTPQYVETAYLFDPVILLWALTGLLFLLFTVSGPIFVACGFALYLNRRIELEGWDIELGFRRLARRIGATTTVVLALGITSGLADVRADDAAVSEEAIDRIITSDDFRQVKTVRYPRFPVDFTRNPSAPDDHETRNWAMTMSIIAAIMEAALWITAAVGILYLVYLAHEHNLLTWPGSVASRPRRRAPGRVLGVPTGSSGLPADVEAQARRLWLDGDTRAALSLLLRATLTWLVEHRACRFHESDTETDCLCEVEARTDRDGHDFFLRLIGAWQTTAWGHHPPTDATFNALIEDFTLLKTSEGPAR